MRRVDREEGGLGGGWIVRRVDWEEARVDCVVVKRVELGGGWIVWGGGGRGCGDCEEGGL